MEHLKEDDACPRCWHQCISGTRTGIGTYSIEEVVLFEGGILDKNGTCNHCSWNFGFVRNCNSCQKDQPCPQHYATGYNGVLNKHMPATMHNLYMRSSPYRCRWEERPCSVGEWYANQVSTYMEAISVLKRFTSNWKIQADLIDLERKIVCDVNLFWPCLKHISSRYFGTSDKISMAVKTFCYVLWKNGKLGSNVA